MKNFNEQNFLNFMDDLTNGYEIVMITIRETNCIQEKLKAKYLCKE